ncbi:MAG: guanylate kinase [Christensenellaceae bacterium]|nr:guanylate kinase [Christensenellaceae bacterium]
MKKGCLLVISGPSGVGKGTIVKALLEKQDNISLSVSCTTRAPREGEVDGTHYYFITKDEFRRMIDEGSFLEYEANFSNFYGTPLGKVQEKLDAGQDVILEIDVKGGLNVKKKLPEAVLIFILPPSLEILRERLAGRGTETEEQIEKRFSEAEREIAAGKAYDHNIVNDTLAQAVDDIIGIINKTHTESEE